MEVSHIFWLIIICVCIFIIFKNFIYDSLDINSIEQKLSHKTITYKDLKFIEHNFNLQCKKIPKLVFRSSHFKRDNMNTYVIDVLNNLTYKNPDYLQVYFSDEDCYNFIREKFPEYLDDYNSLIPTAYKSDLWRLLVIYYYGGIYNDIGHKYLKPIDKIIHEDDELVLVWDNDKTFAIHNAMIAAYPQHPYIKMCIDKVIHNIRNKIYGTSVLDITSCKPMGRIFNTFFNRDNEQKLSKGIFKKLNFKAKMLYLNANSYDITKFVIEDINDQPILLTKFKNYYKVIYNNRNVPHYSELWKNRKVFK